MAMKNRTHGGKRKGSGRKKETPTTTIRVPTKYVKAIKEWLRGLTTEQERQCKDDKPTKEIDIV